MTKDIDVVWPLLQQHQGETFYTAKGLPFTYTIRGGELFVDRRSKSITISTVANALEKIVALEMDGIPITGPKKIGCYGAISIRYCWLWGFLPFPTTVKM